MLSRFCMQLLRYVNAGRAAPGLPRPAPPAASPQPRLAGHA